MEPVAATWKTLALESEFPLELGGSLPGAAIAYESWGELSAARDNVVVVLHALSGSSHAAGAPADGLPGWWEGLLAPGAPLGRDRKLVICPNLIGGCYGSTGPSSIDPRDGRPYRLRFPPITVGDMVEGARRLLRELGLGPERVGPLTLVGGSMGGMLVLEWAARHPEEVGWGIALCSPGRSYPQTIAFRAVQRAAILNDPAWMGGEYEPDRPPARGLALARMIGMITYRSDAEFWQRFQRDVRDPRPHFTEGSYQVQSYLDHQGRKFVKRFDANTYLYYSRAMDLYDLGGPAASFEEGVLRIRSPLSLIAFSSDFLCPPYQSEEVHRILAGGGRAARYDLIPTIHGHDSFLMEIETINRLLAEGPPASSPPPRAGGGRGRAESPGRRAGGYGR